MKRLELDVIVRGVLCRNYPHIVSHIYLFEFLWLITVRAHAVKCGSSNVNRFQSHLMVELSKKRKKWNNISSFEMNAAVVVILLFCFFVFIFFLIFCCRCFSSFVYGWDGAHVRTYGSRSYLENICLQTESLSYAHEIITHMASMSANSIWIIIASVSDRWFSSTNDRAHCNEMITEKNPGFLFLCVRQQINIIILLIWWAVECQSLQRWIGSDVF